MKFAVRFGGKWHIANKVKAENYGEPRTPPHGAGVAADADVWAEDGTTAWIGLVGDEERVVDLED